MSQNSHSKWLMRHYGWMIRQAAHLHRPKR